MRIITKRTLREFWEQHPAAEEQLTAWYDKTKRLDWDSPAAVTASFAEARLIPGNRAIFKIRGNAYRLVVEINYEYRRVYIRFVGTHAAYDRIDAREV